MERFAGQVNKMPACWSFVHHTFLDAIHAAPGCRIRPCKANVLATIREAGKAFIGNARALVKPVGTGMAEAAVYHIPTVQARPACQGGIPGEGVESADSAVVIDQRKKLLRQLNLFCRQRRMMTVRRGPFT